MPTATITPEGHIEVPKDILDRLQLHAGDRLEVQIEDDWAMRIWPRPLEISEVAGMLRSRIKKPLTLEEIDEGVAQAFRRGER